MDLPDLKTLGLIGGVLALLGVASAVLHALKNREAAGLDTAMVETFRQRVRAWWVLFSVLAAALVVGEVVTVVLFGLIAFWALREFITLTPTRPGDHRALFWVFFLLTPLQFVLVGMGEYGLYSILIPVYASLFVLARVALAGDYKRFLERCAKIQAGLLICVYCLSHAPALVTLPELAERDSARAKAQALGCIDQFAAEQVLFGPGDVEKLREKVAKMPQAEVGTWWNKEWDAGALLFFFVLIVQLSDALQYAWSQIPSKHVIVPTINPGKTWEGLIGGTASVTLIGAALCWATPFPLWLAAAMSMVISLTGFAGSLTLSAIKRDRGVADYGTLVEGHGGVLDRIDSLCFAAPVFFHLTRFCLGVMAGA